MSLLGKTIDEFEKEVIRITWRKSANPKAIARVYGVNIETILDILGLPHQGWEDIHRDTAFYDHGNGDNELNIRMNFYGEFLQDGDFEKYQPACYMDQKSEEFQELLIDAQAIPQSDDPVSEARRFWILSRFTEYQGAEWTELRDKQVDLFNKFPGKKFDWFRDSKNLAVIEET